METQLIREFLSLSNVSNLSTDHDDDSHLRRPFWLSRAGDDALRYRRPSWPTCAGHS